MQNYVEVAQQNETEFKDEYEYMIHLYNRQNEFKELFENKFIEAVKEKETIQLRLTDEKEKLEKELKEEKDNVISQFEE